MHIDAAKQFLRRAVQQGVTFRVYQLRQMLIPEPVHVVLCVACHQNLIVAV